MAAPTISLSQILGNANVTDGQLLFANIANTNSGGNANSHANLTWDSANSVLTVKGGSALGTFTGNTANDTLILYGSTALTENVSVRFTDNGLVKARIGVQMNASGSWMSFGTSNNYNTGITNQALVIDNFGHLQSNTSPLQNNVTGVVTALSAVRKTTANLSTSTLSNDSVLIVTVNEAATYHVDCMLFFQSGTAGTNTSMGFLADLAGGAGGGLPGTLTLAGMIKNVGGLQEAGTTVYSSVYSSTTVATPAQGVDWISIRGAATVTGTGTLQVRWAQNFANATQNLSLLQGSYLTLTKLSQ